MISGSLCKYNTQLTMQLKVLTRLGSHRKGHPFTHMWLDLLQMRCMTPLGVKGHIKARVRLGLVLVNLITEQIKPYIPLQVSGLSLEGLNLRPCKALQRPKHNAMKAYASFTWYPMHASNYAN